MKLFTKDFKENKKLIHSMVKKGNVISESICLNFTDHHAYIFSNNISCRIPMLFTGAPEAQRFFVPIDKLLVLSEIADSFNIVVESDSLITFSNNDDTFQFKMLDEKIDVENFSLIKNLDFFELKKDFRDNLMNALDFYADKNEKLNGIFIKNDRMISTDRTKFFDCKLTEAYGDVNFPANVLKLIAYEIKEKSQLSYCVKDNLIYFKIDETQIIASVSKELECPEVFSDNFKKAYDHKDYFILEKEDLKSIVPMMSSFLSNIPNSKVCFSNSKDMDLLISINGESKVKKVLKIVEITGEIKSFSFFVNFNNFILGIENIDSKYIKIQIKKDSPAMNMTAINFDGDKNFKEIDKHVVVVQLK